jgi:hypothetical protein
VEALLKMDPLEVAEENKFPLEFDFELLYRSSLEQQTYWVQAIKTVQWAGRRTAIVWSCQFVGAHLQGRQSMQNSAEVVEQMRATQTLWPLLPC